MAGDLEVTEPEAERGDGKFVWARGSMSESTKDTVARMVAAGLSLEEVSRTVRRTVGSLKRAIDGPLAERIQMIRMQDERELRMHFTALRELLPRLRQVAKEGLASRNEKIRIEVMKWLHEILIPKQAQRVDHDVTIYSSPEVVQAMADIRKSAEALASAPLLPLRIRSGSEALPPIIDVTPVEAQAP